MTVLENCLSGDSQFFNAHSKVPEYVYEVRDL